jgi:hypothetical protein
MRGWDGPYRRSNAASLSQGFLSARTLNFLLGLVVALLFYAQKGSAGSMTLPKPVRYDTVLHADAVEFCPVQGLHDVMVCGTYQLQESEQGGRAEHQTRIGRLYLLRVGETISQHEGGQEEQACLTLKEESRIDVPGVFDIKWSGPRNDQTSILGHAAADGFLYAYAPCPDEGLGLSRLGSTDCRAKDCARKLPFGMLVETYARPQNVFFK